MAHLPAPFPADSADPTPDPEDRRGVAAAVRQWVTGDPSGEGAGRVLRVADARLQGAAEQLLRPDDVLLVPDDRAADDDRTPPPSRTGATVAPYRGGLDEPGDEAWFSGLKVQVEDYASIAFLPLTGATIARLRDLDGWRAYLEDADAARNSGRLLPQLLGATVAVSGAPLVDAGDPVPVAAVDIDRDGVARLGQDGAVLGDLGDPGPLAAALDRSHPPLARLAALGDDLAADVADRPWLGLYRAALAFAAPQDDGPAWSVSGLGTTVAPGGDASRITRSDLLLLHRGEERVLVQPRSLRRFALTARAAVVVEHLLGDGTGGAEGRLPEEEAVDASFLERIVAGFALEGVALRGEA